jgi:drug/metabolite transporter (DMT)-like permease
MKSNRLADHLTVHFAYLVFSLAILSMKYASTFDFGVRSFWGYYLLSLLLMVIYAFFWQKALSIYTLTRAYSWKAVVFIWIFLFSFLFFREPITVQNILGTVMIVSGAVMVNYHD